MPQFAALTSCFSTRCQNILARVLLPSPMCGGRIIGECARSNWPVDSGDLTAPGSEDGIHGQSQKFWINMVSDTAINRVNH